jgi:tetratricopeptide (TPR) repeat protein
LRDQRDAIRFSDILDNASGRVGKDLGNDPEAEADLRDTLGITYAMLGEPVKGETQLLLGLQRLRVIRGGSLGIAASLYLDLCDARSFQGRYADALIACREAVAIYRTVDPRRLGGALHDTAFMAVNAGEPLPEAEKMYREALRFASPHQPVGPACANSRLGLLRLRQGDLEGGERLLLNAQPALRGKDGPLVEIIPVLYASAFGADVRGRYPEAVRLMSEALDLATRKRVTFMQPDELALQLAAYEALAGNRGALSRLQDVLGRLSSGTVAPVDRIRHDLFAGIVEARWGSKIEAERRLRSALATQQKEMSRQPDIGVEIYVRLMELLSATGRQKEAAETARQGLRAAALAYGSYFAAHPFVVEMRKSLP